MENINVSTIVVLAVFVMCCYFAYRGYRRYKFISEVKRSNIGSVSSGIVELSGKCLATSKTIRGPYSLKPCLWYRITVEKTVWSEGRERSHTILSKTSDSVLLLDDGTGVCEVDTTEAEVTTKWEETHYGNQSQPIIPFDKNTYSGNILSTGTKYSYKEERIVENDALYVLGMMHTVKQRSVEEQTEEKKRDILREWKQDYQSLLKNFDRNKDGELDMDEWRKAQKVAERKARYEVLETYDPSAIKIINRPPGRNRIYLISNTGEAKLKKNYLNHVVLGAGIGAILLYLLVLTFID